MIINLINVYGFVQQQYVFLYRCMKEVIEKSQPPGSSSSSCILQIHEAGWRSVATFITLSDLAIPEWTHIFQCITLGTADISNAITNVTSGENDSSCKDALIGNGNKQHIYNSMHTANYITNLLSPGKQDPENRKTAPSVSLNEQKVDGTFTRANFKLRHNRNKTTFCIFLSEAQGMQVKGSGVGTVSRPQEGDQLS